ncbi:hypothetical protein GTW51_19815 [Aurantimonas aggregata]|uniref:Uncharacterized protein n=1 Tax=Aurantimonas aggregata TaxID=2047720 RepID=A0A6L9MMJ4_9HYPH|nr:hypothetical protein [Aurantimonas aggregata]NDV88935.1 hypothetical protein [Aurantimonas aggregata]
MNQTTSTSTPQIVPLSMRPPIPTKLAGSTALTSVVAVGSMPPIQAIQAIETIAPATLAADAIAPTLVPEVATSPDDREDTALLVGLSLWTARQHERYLARAQAADNSVALHRYPTVLVDALRRHADAGDPTCRLVLDWLLAKGIAETGSTASEGAV